MSRHVVGRLADLPAGSRVLVEVEGRQIGIFNIDGQLFALRNQCADQGGPVCEGNLVENYRAQGIGGGRVREWIEDRGYILACPWHGWEYDIRSGTCLWNRSYHLRTYSVGTDGEGNVFVEL